MRNGVNKARVKSQKVTLIFRNFSLKRQRWSKNATAHKKPEKGNVEFEPLKTGVLNSGSINRFCRMHYKKTSHSRARR
ncbi:hypothetical protein Pan241w_24860 [Gimesia alba]|uniref:Uncharacterized protein n=1 Tax=Gimesia alba TaxID=2527973 RepID=A0A517REU5_9PLAN|nr:hypothetical protein Pan241w_24860 [Gimesia alba]